jgi:hypothetical protein
MFSDTDKDNNGKGSYSKAREQVKTCAEIIEI